MGSGSLNSVGRKFTKKNISYRNQLVFIIISLILLYMLQLHSFLLFHTFVELIGVGVALGIFFITWNSKDNIESHFFLFAGICHFFIAIIAVLHTLAYKGMNIFEGFDANLPTQLWILGGYLQAVTFLAAQFFFNKKINPNILFYGGLLVTATMSVLIFKGWFPDCFIEGKGLTNFKKISEMLICLIFFAAIIPIRRTAILKSSLKTSLTTALVINGFSRFAFILYVGVYDLSNVIGHILYLVYTYFIYRVIIEESLTKPQNIFFSRLNEQKEALEELSKTLEIKVAQRTRELEKINASLTMTNRELEDFAQIVSHDLREPLRGINNLAAILFDENGRNLDGEGQYMLETILRLARRQENMISALLKYSKLRQYESSPSRVDLNILVAEICDNLQLQKRQPQVDIRIPRPLPTLRFSRTLLEQILSNLINNAARFNDKPEKWIEIGTLPGDHPPVIYVRDNGIGISGKFFDEIFIIFTRLHGKDDWGGGTGVGLAIVHNIITRNNGKIWLESTEGEGSVFFFSLPDMENHCPPEPNTRKE